LALMVVRVIRRREPILVQQFLVVLAVAYGTVCFAYNFHVARFRFDHGTMVAHFEHRESDWVTTVPFQASFTAYLPGGDFVDGLGAVYRHNRTGDGRPYLFGKGSPTYKGWKTYFIWALLLKFPSLALALCLCGIGAIVYRRRELSRGFWLA